jgi:creatinine amidohydrolase/Fe(II)-dependent formamide hydrolase-like protein
MKGLVVIDRLEVGPVVLEKRRLTVPYRVFSGGKEDSIDFIYRFEEDVFDPDDPLSRNLASLMAAQVAMNYGLFCKTIVFKGEYDETDTRFITDMTENTCREIYVKKLLEPNPFLIGDAVGLKPVKKKTYCVAKLVFEGPSSRPRRSSWSLRPSSADSHAILSSGGKDSLLTFGLLEEMGKDIHPVFVNESGRHWFTALNAYRFFKENVPGTARVWVNSDRVFAWMLRHFPFIRQDFATLRADQYPLRLWTVAIFLFGVLPIVISRGIGRIVIGDEFDTTQKTSFMGITHYNGYYDQSIYFDSAMSRFFMRKGWAMCQFSILRPMAEILIEKTLAERYPRYQEHQISCHAAHKEGDRFRPCGSCEKCRRIVGMLSAFGIDPSVCGYLPEQTERCLSEIVTKGDNQEAGGKRHMAYLLAGRGLIDLPPEEAKKLEPSPEIMKLRFHPRLSPIESIPVDLREDLYRILLQHAEGSLRYSGRKWEEFDVLDDPTLANPYPFEFDRAGADDITVEAVDAAPSDYLWGEMTWPEAKKRFGQVDIALLPVGSIEQHGPHLPLDSDAFDADYLSRRIAEACSDPKPLVLPLVPYGVSYEHDGFSGTVGINNDTLSRLVYDIGMSVARNGIRKLVIINGHGGNNPALHYAAQMITRDTRIFVCVDTGETSDVDLYRLVETPNDIHAGEIETSTSLAVRPHLVRFEKAVKAVPQFSSRYLNFTSKRGVSWYVHTEKISRSGVLGDPTKATVEKGEKFWKIMIAHLVALVEDLKNMTLDEIYQRKY